MCMKKIFVFLLMAFAFAAHGQSGGEKARVDAMKSLDFLVGEWVGDGWIVRGRDDRATFHQRETVRAAAGNSVVVIDGLGTSTVAGNEGKVTHQAFAVVSYDAAAGKYQWRAYTPANGELSEAAVAVKPGGSLVSLSPCEFQMRSFFGRPAKSLPGFLMVR